MIFSARKFIVTSSVLLLLSCGATRLSAQSVGSIRGTVTDASGAVIDAATVTVTNTGAAVSRTGATNNGTALSRTEATNKDGIFVFPDLPIGVYALEITKPGFETQKRVGTVLLTGQTLEIQVLLAVGSSTQSVEVTSEARSFRQAHPAF